MDFTQYSANTFCLAIRQHSEIESTLYRFYLTNKDSGVRYDFELNDLTPADETYCMFTMDSSRTVPKGEYIMEVFEFHSSDGPYNLVETRDLTVS